MHTSLPRRLIAILAPAILVASAASGASFVRNGAAWECALTGCRVSVDHGAFSYYERGTSDPALTYRLREVRLAGRTVAVGDASAEAHGSVLSLQYTHEIVERYTARAEGVEQSWTIASKPRGEIVIVGELQSELKPVRTGDGWRFVDRSGRAVFGYGGVTVIDRAGRKMRCSPHIEHGSIMIRVPAAFVKRAEFPIVVDPVVGPEVAVCPTYAAAAGNQENVEIAAGPSGYLAVWQDSRGPDNIDIFACRISPTGQVLDVLGITVSDATGDQTDPAVVWDGTQYLVVWADRREANQHIYGARVRPNGEVIDKQGILISGSSGSQAYAKVASDGAGSLVVWQDSSGTSPDIRGRRVYGDGQLSSTYGISTRLDNEETPDIAWNGTNFFVVWCDYRNSATTDADIYGCRVAKTGVRMAGDYLISCTSGGTTGAANAQRFPRICSYGTACFVVWQDQRNSTTVADVYGSRVTSGGTVQDKGGKLIATVANSQETPAIGYNGTRMLVTWRDGTDRQIKGARVDTSGNVQDASGRVISTGMAGAGGVATRGQGGKFIVGWNSLSVTESDALTTLVTDSGTVETPAGTTVSTGLVTQQDYAVADNGTEYAVVWSQLVNGSWDILGARISRAGALLTPTPVNLTSSIGGDQIQPSIAWSGSQYLLVWSGNETLGGANWDIRGWCLNSSLAKIGASATVICSATEGQTHPRVYSNRTNYLVVWEDSRNAVSPYYYTDLYGATLSTAGAVTKSDIAISLSTGDQLNAAVGSDNSNYFVVWEDYRAGYPLVYGSRVTSSGTVQDAAGIAMPSSSYNQTGPSIVYGGGNYFVVWSDWTKITGCRVTTAGSKLDTAGITIDTGSQKLCPSVCYDGSKYRVVWEDYRSSFAGNADIYYTTVNTSGVVSTEPKTALVADLVPQYAPHAFSQTSSGLLLYVRYFNFSQQTCSTTLTDMAAQVVGSIAAAKAYPAGSLLTLNGKIVTGTFSGYFYMEDESRLSGIKVISSIPVGVNDLADVTGIITISDGERQLNATNVAALGVASNPPRPAGMRGDWVGGSALNPYTPGITGAYGWNNIGLLVKTWGTVASTGGDYFYVQVTPALQIKVACGSLTKPVVGKMVAVTGISTCEIASGATVRMIRARIQSDIRTLN